MTIAKNSPVATGVPLAATLLSTRNTESFQHMSTTGLRYDSFSMR